LQPQRLAEVEPNSDSTAGFRRSIAGTPQHDAREQRAAAASAIGGAMPHSEFLRRLIIQSVSGRDSTV